MISKNFIYKIAILIVFVLFVFFDRYPLRGLFVEFSDFKEIKKNVFVSPNSSNAKINDLIKIVSDSYSRNDSLLWKGIKSNKKIIFCENNITFSEYCPDTLNQAVFLSTPYSSHIVIGPNGLNTNILSHEICHAEFFERLGPLAWYKIKIAVPVWFNEGLAMQVSLEDKFNTANFSKFIKKNQATIENVKKLNSYDDFFENEDKIWFNYFASKLEVETWLKSVKEEGLNELINSIDKWGQFDDTYNEIKTKSLQDSKNIDG